MFADVLGALGKIPSEADRDALAMAITSVNPAAGTYDGEYSVLEDEIEPLTLIGCP